MIEFLFDYLFILAYLLILFLGSMLIYIIFFNGIPEFTEIQSQWLVFLTSILPITLLFTYLDYAKNGSFGKVKAGLELVYQKKTVQASLIRNTIKFLPWQLGHMGTIHGFYSNFDGLSIILSILATLLAISLLAMTLFRKDKRHLGDLLACTQVQLKEEQGRDCLSYPQRKRQTQLGSICINETVEFTNLCMVRDGDRVLVIDRKKED